MLGQGGPEVGAVAGAVVDAASVQGVRKGRAFSVVDSHQLLLITGSGIVFYIRFLSLLWSAGSGIVFFFLLFFLTVIMPSSN